MSIQGVRCWAFALALCLPAAVLAESDQEAKLDEVMEVVDAVARIPEQGIPPVLLHNAEAVAVIPSVLKVGLVVGGRYGKGVLVVRRADGRWSDPVFVSIAGGSVGWQIGAQSTDVVLVFKSRKGIESLMKHKFTLGADAAVAAGPVGREAAAATDAALKAEIYSYSRSRGLFAGVSLDGAVLQIENGDNALYYRAFDLTPRQIFAGAVPRPPESAEGLRSLLADLEGN